MLKSINIWREQHAYKTYAKLNAKRKAREASNALFTAFDKLRRRTGYVK